MMSTAEKLHMAHRGCWAYPGYARPHARTHARRLVHACVHTVSYFHYFSFLGVLSLCASSNKRCYTLVARCCADNEGTSLSNY